MADTMGSLGALTTPGFMPPPPPGFLRTPPPPPPPLQRPAPAAIVLQPVTTTVDNPIRWRWWHLMAFGFVAFGLPQALAHTLSQDLQSGGRVSEFLDQALFLQVVGYLLAAYLAVHMVRTEQKGDWSSLGITWGAAARPELLGGAVFGFLLLIAFLPISYVLQGGELRIDELLRVLVGSTNGMGLVLASIVVVIGAPVIEEIYYRGLLYEKLARKNTWVAIVVSALLFTVAHGALLIPAILLMGFALGWQRRKRTLWFTMGAHAAWNLCVLVMGAFVVLGGWSFSPPDAAYTITLPKSWERTEIPIATAAAPATIDLAVSSSSGSYVGLMRVPAVGGSARATIDTLVANSDKLGLGDAHRTEVQPHDHLFDDGAESFHVTYGLEDKGVQVAAHIFVLLKPGSPTALVVNFVCPRPSCVDDGGKLDDLLHGLKFH